jgi:CheY-like chemotaxis protein
VAERTRTLADTQAALQRSQRLESLGKLTGGVAHDFNNILQVIGGNVQLLQGYLSGNEMATKRLEYALGAVDRGAKLSSHLLAFARRQPLVPVVMSPGRVIKNMDEMLHRTLGESIDIETVIGGGLWNTLIDPNQLENVVLNLCINARDAMTNGGKLTIEIGNSMLNDEYALKDDVPAGQYVMLAVSDTGTGMAPEILTQACEPFFTTKPEGEGTGLGLSMAYGFVRQSGGHFKIYSEVGHGTTVKMYFPRSYEEEMEFVPLPTGPIVGGNETILVVEDDPAVQATVVEMLTSLGYKVLKADNAGSALIILRSGLPIDLLFTDVVMPGPLRSPELAKKAKALIPSIEILFTSGYTQNAIVHGGRLDPGVQLLSKPYRQEQLARKIRHMLGNRKQLEIAKDPAKLRLVPSVDPSVSPAESLRVLVVEDVEDLLMLACEFVSILGHKADGALSAEEALECLKRCEYDLLVTDIGLPGMNGRELAQMAKTMYPHIKIVYASGYGDAGEGDAFASVVLSKPYELNQLTAALNKARVLRD